MAESSEDRIALVFPLDELELDEDAGVARYRMTLEALERWLPHLEAASRGMVPSRFEVRGGDG